ncbi:23 kDa integral membrane protein [Drosophila grimshawi]|uniref:Tetraspanin n=1 Tax=Drosophila grimshawi TaxID=7222 RepID=B4J3W5_DROGR|nr:23 kDa integral membrane protein [Drosophila grimshawi]EDW01548.1 GH21496 [Drosophila grimshawi]
MNCLSATVKYLLYLLNVVFVAGGILLLVVGSIMLSDIGTFDSFSDTVNGRTIPICIIVLGCIIFVVAFIGCSGTIRENAGCTTVYAVCMFILFALQLALSIWIFVEYDNFVEKMGNLVDTAFKENDSDGRFPMDTLQQSLECCGVKDFTDYGDKVPLSCCGYLKQGETCEPAVYTARPGCREKFTDFWKSNMSLISWGSLIIALFELTIFVISCCLASAMRKR